ncbi:protein FAM13A-like isoform X2 [Haliotis rubra]|uniref:protein FAM13A-like isoform X2 n=1 Tax=Haliotis rubra TaxID=36100 RepID=UPI001EE514BC|nr:protein FAM13A-like isoform X2 [Haliotis rubra]
MKYTSVPGPPTVNMAEYNVTPKGPDATGVPMDRVKKLLSPASRRKLVPSNNVNKTFGAPLEVLVKRSPNCLVPSIVKKTCDFISRYGMDQEGIFRVNGNARVLEKLRYSFDQHWDTDIEEDCDVMAVAGLLKMFLRELPDTVIPLHMTQDFVNIQEGNKDHIVQHLKDKLKELPTENYNLLKFLCQFLVVVTHHEKDNKMSPMALAIVFGPNLFKCGDGISGLRNQGTTNQIVFKLIAEYNTIFKQSHEDSPIASWEKRYKMSAPPRPPPPKISASADDSLNLSSPRNTSMKSYDSSQYQEMEEMDLSDTSPIIPSSGGRPHLSGIQGPYVHDAEDYPDRSASPFITDSEGHSIIESPVVTARTHELVEKTISQSIVQHIFGDRLSVSPQKEVNSHSTSGSTGSDGNVASLNSDNSERSDSEPAPAVKDRISVFEAHIKEDDVNGSQTRPGKQRPTSAVFDFFENKSIIISKAPKSTELRQEESPERDSDSSDMGVDRDTQVLSSFKKPVGPPRRSPSRKFRRSLEGHDLDSLDAQIGELLQDTEPKVDEPLGQTQAVDPRPRPMPVPRKQPLKPRQQANSSSDEDEDMNHNNQFKSRIAFLDIHLDKQLKPSQVNSPDHSPVNVRKPFVPPLDLTILHEHVDSSDPIPARATQSAIYMMRKPVPQDPAEDLENAVIVSPRSVKLKKKNGWASSDEEDAKNEAPPSPSARMSFPDESVAINTDIPPSPPVEQDQYKKHGPDDESSQKLRQLTKRIQLLKKRIKIFDENFEKEHGYRPSHHDKAAHTEVKKYMTELSRARKELKKLKEEAEMGSRSRHGSGASSSGERGDIIPTMPPSIEGTLDIILKNLQEKRREMKRPREISMMSYEQVLEEKLAVQKALLHFESIHGRPSSKNEKDLMRPLYDRYRSIKRLLAKPTSPRNTIDLETVPEDQPMQISTTTTSTSKFRNVIRVPTSSPDSDEIGDLGTMEFAVTRDFSILRETGRHIGYNKNKLSTANKKSDSEDEDDTQTTDFNVNDLSIPELQDEVQRAKIEKKRLRKVLRTFEEDFLTQQGRRVQKEDRSPMQGEYSQYKQIKAKLRLLEALLTKHHQGFTDRV